MLVILAGSLKLDPKQSFTVRETGRACSSNPEETLPFLFETWLPTVPTWVDIQVSLLSVSLSLESNYVWEATQLQSELIEANCFQWFNVLHWIAIVEGRNPNLVTVRALLFSLLSILLAERHFFLFFWNFFECYMESSIPSDTVLKLALLKFFFQSRRALSVNQGTRKKLLNETTIGFWN